MILLNNQSFSFFIYFIAYYYKIAYNLNRKDDDYGKYQYSHGRFPQTAV